MSWSFKFRAGESTGARIVRCCRELLSPGPVGKTQRTAVYRAFVSVGLDKDGGARLSTIKTSCAIFVRGVWGWCGDKIPHPWIIGWPMFHGWLGPRSKSHSAWVRWTGAETPSPGDVFFIEKPGTNNNHVGVFLREISPGTWETAEGGGGDGTECRIARRVLTDFDDSTIWDFDPKLKRTLQGWWRADRLGLPASPSQDDEPADSDDDDDDDSTSPGRPTPQAFEWRTLRATMRGPDVKAWQDLLLRDGYSVGPAGADGSFGARTTSATRAWQRDRGLVSDGIVGPKTRAAIGKPRLSDPRLEAPAPARKEELYRFPGIDRTTPSFRDELVAVATRLNIDPNAIAAVMSIESGFRPNLPNPHKDKNGESAVGLIQFMPFVLRAMGTSYAAFLTMSATEQLPFVERFYRSAKGTRDAGTLYMLTFLPAYAHESDDFVLGEKDSDQVRAGLSLHKIYEQNSVLDKNKDGKITAGEVKALARNRYAAAKAAGVYTPGG